MSDASLYEQLLGARGDGRRRVAPPALPAPEAPFDGEAPPVPSMDELLRPTPGVARFLEALGPPVPADHAGGHEQDDRDGG